jgi:hypothetical protein
MEAYKIVASGEEPYSCNAILRAAIAQGMDVSKEYGELFKPDCFVGSRLQSWLDYYVFSNFDIDDDLVTRKDIQNWRKTALAFAIAMSKTGDL